jgi:hypothetical protein
MWKEERELTSKIKEWNKRRRCEVMNGGRRKEVNLAREENKQENAY